MHIVLQQVMLAFGMGAIIALAGQGVVQIFRGSGVLNFAHGAMALASAQVFAWAWADRGWPLPVAIPLGVLTGAALGLLTHVLVMRPLRAASQLVQIIATIGVMQVVLQSSQLVFGSEPRQVGSFLPQGAFEIGGVHVPKGGLVLLCVALVTTAALAIAMNLTRFGLATRAVAQSELASRSLGHSPGLIAGASWTIGGALAGLAGTLVVPVGGVAISSIVMMAVPAFAAAVLGGFNSYLVTTLGAVVIASSQAVFTFQAVAHGWPSSLAPSLPFVVVVAVLVLRSQSIPTRDHVMARLPRLGLGRPPRWAWFGAAAVIAGALLSSTDLANALITTALTAVIGLSLVVCTGLSGQISFAQYAMAGIGALVAARASADYGWPFLVCGAVGVLAAASAGAVFALPAMRTRGPSLAVVTIGLGLAVQQGLLTDTDITGGFNGATPVARPRLFGLDVNAVDHPERYAALCIAVFFVMALTTLTLGRSPIGRRLIAVRGNERAAASMGVRVAATKVFAFSVSSAMAGVGGVLMAFRYDTVQYSQFTFSSSLQLVTFVLIGGIGFVAGPAIGAIGVPSGLLAWAVSDLGDVENWLLLGSGALLILTLIKAPDGAASMLRRRRADVPVIDRSSATPPWDAAELTVDGITVRYGGFIALDDVSLSVRPGEVTGLIGANGAGKTTLIDAVSGFASTAGGRITLGDVDVTELSAAARARAGVARCFQSIDLFGDLTVRQNLLVGAEHPSPAAWPVGFFHAGDGALTAEAHWVVEQLDLAELLDLHPASLSHGQRRLVGVARALVGRPRVLLLDEPAAGLDRAETDRLGEVIRLIADMGLGVLLVEHDVELVTRVSDRVVAIDTGTTIYEGDARGAIVDEQVRLAYLGVAEPTAEITTGNVVGVVVP